MRKLTILFLLISLQTWAQTAPKLMADASPPATPAKPAAAVNLEPEPEQWKGKPYNTTFQFSLLAGIATFGNFTGFGLDAAIAFKILHHGFVDDINDQVYIEVVGGPTILFNGAGTVGFYGTHLRWEFHKNDMWTFYAIGGFGGNFSGANLNNVGVIFPRFGIGTFWNLFQFMSFRVELSRELIGVGIVYLL